MKFSLRINKSNKPITIKVSYVHCYDEILGLKYSDGEEVYSKKYYRIKEIIELCDKSKDLISKLDKNYLDDKSYKELRHVGERLKELSQNDYRRLGIGIKLEDVQDKFNQYKYDNYQKYSLSDEVKGLIAELRSYEEAELDSSDEDTIGGFIDLQRSIILQLEELKVDPVYYDSNYNYNRKRKDGNLFI